MTLDRTMGSKHEISACGYPVSATLRAPIPHTVTLPLVIAELPCYKKPSRFRDVDVLVAPPA
jgi:hypothetical protein